MLSSSLLFLTQEWIIFHRKCNVDFVNLAIELIDEKMEKFFVQNKDMKGCYVAVS